MKKILILGAGGFLGKNACYHFAKSNYEIIQAYSNIDLRIEQNCTDLIKKFKPEIILQFAANTSNSNDVINAPWLHVTDNAIMNSYIFKAAVNNGVKHVIFPSCTTMYPGDLNRPVTEADFSRDKIYPKYFGVASTKVYIEDLCKFWSTIGDTKFTAIRHSNIYGPHDRFNLKTGHVCASLIKKIVDAKNNDEIEIWGKGTEIRDLLPVHSLMYAIHQILEKQTAKFDLVNIGRGIGISVIELAKVIADLCKKNISFKLVGDAPTLEFNLILNSSYFIYQYGDDYLSTKENNYFNLSIESTIEWYKKSLRETHK